MLSELHVKLKRKDWVSKKIYREICVKGINFLTALTPFYVILCCFLCLLPSPSQVTFLLNGTHGWCSVMISWVNGRKYENLLPLYFSWLPALSSKAIYFLSIMSFSINKLKSHLLFTYKNLCFMILCGKKVLLQEMVRGRRGGLAPPSPHPHLSLQSCIVLKYHPHHLTKYESKGKKFQFSIFLVNWEKFGNVI